MTSKLARSAPGGPGIEPRWTHAQRSQWAPRIRPPAEWYTLDAGCVTEIYYQTIDTPQIRDRNSSSPTAKTFFHDERRNFTSEIEPDCLLSDSSFAHLDLTQYICHSARFVPSALFSGH
jgi:hypothetical protein